jgi:imidazolonepropionase-like amidohydrolase
MSDTTRFTVISAARVLDGSGRPPLEAAAVLIENDHIVRIGATSEVSLPEGASARSIDYGDATILPGLVDAHTHLVAPGDGTPGDDVAREADDILLLQAARNARIVLSAGVTTVRENGAKNRTAFSLREAIRRGIAVGPQMVICGRPITMTGGHMWYFGGEADGVDGVRVAVRRLLKEGGDYIKIVATGGTTRTSDPNRASYTLPELQAITDEAHRQGRLTASHCTSTQGVEQCLDAGVDMIIHSMFVEPDGTYRFRQDLVDRMVEADVWINPTLYVMKVAVDRQMDRRAHDGQTTAVDFTHLERSKRILDHHVEAVNRMMRAGARIAAGSDSPWGWYGPGEFVEEIGMLAETGLPSHKAIVAATADAADSIGVGAKAGRLGPGRVADIVVFRGNPLRDVRALRDVVAVYQGGRRVGGEIP